MSGQSLIGLLFSTLWGGPCHSVSEMKWQVPCTGLHCKPRWSSRASVLRALTASSGSACSSVKHGPSRQGVLSANLWAPTTWQGPENKVNPGPAYRGARDLKGVGGAVQGWRWLEVSLKKDTKKKKKRHLS